MKFYSDILAKAGLIVDGTTQLNTIANASIDTDKFIVSDSGVIKYRTGTQLASDIDAMTKTVYDSDNDGTVDDAEKIIVTARNSTGSTIYKGTIVYFSGSTGNRPNMLKAQAHTEATSSKTFGVVVDDVADNSDGQVAAMGTLHDLDTRSSAPNPFTSDTLVDGDVLWLSPTTAGYVTRTKPTSPNHAVFIGYVARTSPTNGRIVYKIQNGLELDELHNVSASTPSNNDGIFYNSTTGLWEAKAISAISGVSGSGTTNYISKWATASSLGDSQVFDNGTSVGVGTSTPSATYKLEVNNGLLISAPYGTLSSDYQTGVQKLPQLIIEGVSRDNLSARFSIRAGGWHTSTWFGSGAMLNWSNTVGGAAIQNAAFGFNALNLLTSGNNNDAFGAFALNKLTTGIEDTAFGRDALGSLQTGSYNASVGLVSLYDLTTGSYNTAIGNRTGRGITTGSYNTIIGARVAGLSATLSNHVIIADGQANMRIVSFNDGNVYIGGSTSLPTNSGYKLDINGDIRVQTIANATTDTDRFLVSDSGVLKYRTGSELLSDIGAQPALTNPVTGTGTTNYLPKWTGTTALGNSLVYDDGTNVGIGTASPAYKLDVNGVIKSASGLYVGPVNYAAASINVSSFTTKGNFANSVMTLSSTETGSGGIYPTQIIFAQEGATVGWSIQSVNQGVAYTPLILNPNGSNVLIGTNTNAGYKLDVNGDLRLQTIANATTDTDRFIVSDSGVIKYRTGSEILSDIGAQPLLTNPVTGTGTTNTIPKFTGSSAIGDSKLTDASNVLAYTAVSGNAYLHIKSPAGYYYPQLTFYSNGTSATSIMGYLSASYYDAAGGIRLNGGGTGNVMIGTNTDSGYKLDVNGKFRAQSFWTESSGGFQYVNFDEHAIFSQSSGRRFQFNNDGGASLQIYNDRITALRRFDWLQSASNPTTGTSGTYYNTTDKALRIYSDATFGWSNILQSNGSVVMNDIGGDYDVRIEGDTDANLFFTDASTDRVGIGNNAPAYKLDVTGDIRSTTSAYFATTSGAVGVNTTSIDSSALFQVDSTTKGILPPRMTSTQRAAISTPAVGLLVYQTDGTEGTYEYASTGWRIINAASSGGVTDGDKGDITVSGSGATWTIDSSAVTYAKIQNVADNRILGRSAGSAGTVQEITIGTGLSLSSGTLTATGTSYSVASVSTTHTETATSGTKVLKADTTGGTFTITLPTAVGNTATIIIKKVAGSATLTIDGNGSETIDGGTTASIVDVYESVTLISDNSNWQII